MNYNDEPEKEKPEQRQNPTLDTPGTQVADYGNPAGGSADEEAKPKPDTDKVDKSKIEPLKGGEETIGNP